MMFAPSYSNEEAPLPRCPRTQPGTEPLGHLAPTPRPLLPCWAAQALCALERGEKELLCLRQQQLGEVERVSRALDRAVLGARREECRLVERLEQDRRDVQRRLEQVQRENCAAERVARTLVEQRLHHFVQLREQIQSAVCRKDAMSSERLLCAAAQLIQPWEIALALKRVGFHPSSYHKPVTFGEVHVRELSVSLSVGVCRTARGHGYPLHTVGEQQATSQCMRAEMDRDAHPLPGRRSPWAVTKLRLSPKEELGSGEQERSSFTQQQRCPPQDVTDSKFSHEENLPSGPTNQRKDKFQAESKLDEHGQEGDRRRALENSKSHENQLVVPADQSCGAHCLYPISGDCPCSCLDDYPLRTSNERMKASSQISSMNSSRHKIPLNSQLDYYGLLSQNHRLSVSYMDLSPRNTPSADITKDGRLGSASFQKHPSPPQALWQSPGSFAQATCLGSGQVCRSLSMSAIERGRGGVLGGKPEPTLKGCQRLSCTPQAGHLLRQFGKQGSGRADFTLPSGVHATPQGQLFVVDCGNARVQVMDSWGNVLQQVSPADADGSARRCRNYFDVAVNAKGMIVLSCAAQRALLVFNRHGRHLQTFGGAGLGAKDELQAPRGVAVSHSDRFLVADLRRGTLFVLKLDPRTGLALEQTEVQGFHRPYLVAANLSTGLVAVSERGSGTDRAPCVKVLDLDWTVIRSVGMCCGSGPVLSHPWGICIDGDGSVLVTDWAQQHQVVVYPAQGVGYTVVSEGLDRPRGLALLPEGHLVVSDSMHHCIKVFQYK